MALRAVRVNGKEYPARRIERILMQDGRVTINYDPVNGSPIKIIEKFRNVDFLDDKDGG